MTALNILLLALFFIGRPVMAEVEAHMIDHPSNVTREDGIGPEQRQATEHDVNCSEAKSSDNLVGLAKKCVEVLVAFIGAHDKSTGATTNFNPIPAFSNTAFSLNPFELGDLPESIVQDLNLTKGEKHEAQVIDLFVAADRPLSVKEVVVGMYRTYGETHKRNNINTRLHRLAERDFLEVSMEKRGVYRLSSSLKELMLQPNRANAFPDEMSRLLEHWRKAIEAEKPVKRASIKRAMDVAYSAKRKSKVLEKGSMKNIRKD